jgi:hypothetical protein
MLGVATRNQHRHYKTLIVLVLAMTVGAFVLFWAARVSPVTPLRGTREASADWTRISVRAEAPAASRGFFHYRIDAAGRLFQSYAWKAGQGERNTPGTIHVLLTCPDERLQISPEQAGTLSQIISKLRHRHAVPADRVRVEPTADRGAGEDAQPSRLRRT